MRAVLQRVKYATVKVDGETVGQCERGFMILLGVGKGDTNAEADLLARKILALRVFPDENGKMNKSITDIGGQALVISQFTLYANCRNGNRPDFFASAEPTEADRLYEYFFTLMRNGLCRAEKGIFGADMKVELLNDGPVTICLDTDVLKQSKTESRKGL